MFPGMGNINPKQIQSMMKQMGIKTEEIDAKRVVFELKDKKIVIENPKVTVMDMKGQKTFTVLGDATEESLGVPEDDIKMVAEQTGATEDEAKIALENVKGDIAEAITELKKK